MYLTLGVFATVVTGQEGPVMENAQLQFVTAEQSTTKQKDGGGICGPLVATNPIDFEQDLD